MSLVLAQTPTSATIGLIFVFFVLFPLLVHGLIVFIGAQLQGEYKSNRALVEDGADIGEGLTPRTGGSSNF